MVCDQEREKRSSLLTLFYLHIINQPTTIPSSVSYQTLIPVPVQGLNFTLQYYLMNYSFSVLVLVLLAFLGSSADPAWYSIPSLRTGQVQCVVSLMTAEDKSTNITDTAFNYYTALGGVNLNELQYGLSLISYESWMTDTFSFNVTMVTYSYTGAVVRFTVLDNTFFTKAKIHYMMIWRGGPVGSTWNGAAGYYNMQVIYGCYLTSTLLVAPTTGSRNETVGGIQTSAIATPLAFPYASLVMKTMIAGLQLKNSVGNNDYVKITPALIASARIQYRVDVQANNLLTFFCVSTVILDPSITINTYIVNVEYNTYILTASNSGLTNVPYSLRYDGSDRMFFGVSEFNLSMSDTRYLNVQTANISLVSLLYASNSAMNQLTYNAFFFARRGCTSPAYYDPVNYTCVVDSTACVNAQPVGSPAFVCKPCHYSCLGCTVGNSRTSCSACTTGVFRSPSGASCPCDNGYADVGVLTCSFCNLTLIGCQRCLDNQTCTQCDSTTYTLISGKCICLPGYFMASGYCLTYAGCLVATYFNNIVACQTCDQSLNFVMVTTNYTCKCNTGYFYNSTVPTNVSCYDVCGDNITAFGKCDDGNNITGDGCDSTCNIENGYHCSYNFTGGVPGVSVCVLKEDITVSYLYAERYIDTNSFKMAFMISPAQSGLTATSFDKNFNSTLPITSSKVTCDPATSMIFLQGEYLQDLEGTSHSAYISFENMTFYADAQYITFTATGINAKLVFDQYTSTNTILQYIVMGQAFVALLVTIFASVVGLKLVGIELLIPIQLIYFALATIPPQRTYNSVLSSLKYSNGFNTIATYAYTRTYSQNKSLAAMTYETEFLLSTNIMLGIFVFILLWLLVHHFRLKYKQYKLQKFLQTNALVQPPAEQKQNSVDSEQDRQDGQQDQQKMKLKKKKKVYSNNNSDLQKEQSKLREDHHRSFKVFTFQVDRAYFIFYLILINQMMFGFIIMTLNVPILTFTYPEEINVLVCNFIFFIFIGNIVFISYDQESNKMIAFTCIKDRYAYIYILLDFIIITALSMTFQESFSTYLICALSLGFVVLVIKEKPYSGTFLTLENLVALYLQIMLFVSLVVLCLIRSVDSEKMSLIFTFLIMGLIAIGEILTIIRVVVKVNFKKAFDDLKNPHKDNQNDKKAKKVIEKNLDLLEEQKNVNMIPPESINGLFAPKEKMVDWESRNTEQYESMHQREVEENGEEEEHPVDHEEQGSENKESDLNKLEILKKKLRNNLKMKREQEMLKKGI